MPKLSTIPYVAFLLLASLLARESSGQQPSSAASVSEIAVATLNLIRVGGQGLLHEPLDQDLPSAFVQWYQQQPFTSGKKLAPLKVDQHLAFQTNNQFVIYYPAATSDNTYRLPILHNSIQKIELDHHEIPIKLRPGTDAWEIEVPGNSKPSEVLPCVTLHLDGPARVRSEDVPVVTPKPEGSIVLHARDAIPTGKMLRFEPQPQKNTIGYWVNPSDFVQWRFALPDRGRYQVVLRYGCGTGQGGSRIKMNIGESELSFQVRETGGFQQWVDVDLGMVELPAGESSLKVSVVHLAKSAVMDIQSITLNPM